MVSFLASNPCHPKRNTYYAIVSLSGCYIKLDGEGKLGCAKTVPTSSCISSTNDTATAWSTQAESDGSERWYREFHIRKQDGNRSYVVRNKQSGSALEINGSDENGTLGVAPFNASKIEQQFEILSLDPSSNEHKKGPCVLYNAGLQLYIEGTNDDLRLTSIQAPENSSLAWNLRPQPCDPFLYQSYRLVHHASKNVAGIRFGTMSPEAVVTLLSPRENGDNVLFLFVLVDQSKKIFRLFPKALESGARRFCWQI